MTRDSLGTEILRFTQDDMHLPFSFVKVHYWRCTRKSSAYEYHIHIHL